MWHSSYSSASCRSVTPFSSWSQGSDARNEHYLGMNRWQEDKHDCETERDEHPERKVGWSSRSEATEAARMSSSEEHKTFNKASRWSYSRAATGRGAGRARCGLYEHGRQQEQAPPDMRSGQSAQACLRREVPTDLEAHSQSQWRQLRRVATTELRRDCSLEAEAEHRDRSHPHSLPQRELTREGLWRRAGATKLWLQLCNRQHRDRCRLSRRSRRLLRSSTLCRDSAHHPQDC